jgi:hypothetical protein
MDTEFIPAFNCRIYCDIIIKSLLPIQVIIGVGTYGEISTTFI